MTVQAPAPKLDLSLPNVISQLDKYSVEELWLLQEQLTQRLRQKTTSSPNKPLERPDVTASESSIFMPKLTPQEIEAHLREVFGDEYDEIMATDISNLPKGSISLSEMVNQDREDRV